MLSISVISTLTSTVGYQFTIASKPLPPEEGFIFASYVLSFSMYYQGLVCHHRSSSNKVNDESWLNVYVAQSAKDIKQTTVIQLNRPIFKTTALDKAS